MTLSNFDWTDKDSVKWFILLPSGHEGPYSLKFLLHLKEQKKIASDVKIWCEGLSAPIYLKVVLSGPPQTEAQDPPEIPVEDLPPLPSEEVDLPPLPLKQTIFRPWVFISVATILVTLFVISSLVKSHENFDIARPPKMSMNLHTRIIKEHEFQGWDKKIFFREYLSDDHSRIWFVTSGFQHCSIEASFRSLEDKMLSLKDEAVAFKSQGILNNHIVEFSSFDFSRGNKIIPGLYEADIRASDCKWNGLLVKLMNQFSAPAPEYQARIKVVLFSKGPMEFKAILDKLLKKKIEQDLKTQNQVTLFWQDLQQKFETLQAITMQIEQLLIDLTDNTSLDFKSSLKITVDQYTKQFGSFLTSFVMENESYFQGLNPESKGVAQRRNYEVLIRLTSKKIGEESMKFIEEFQKIKSKPTKKELAAYASRIRKVYAQIKKDINAKLTQISADRSK